VSQTDGDPLPQEPVPRLLSGQAPAGMWEVLAGYVAARGYRLERGDCGEANGWTDFATHTIRVRPDVDDAHAVKTLVHEIGHLMLHGGVSTVLQCRGVVEVEAESVAYLVAAYHGLDTSGYTFPYVTTWANRADADPAEVVRATGQRVITAAQQVLQHTEAKLSDTAAARQPAQVDTNTRGQARSGGGERAITVQAGHPRPPTDGGRSLPPPGRSSTAPVTHASKR
jgi:hypothetical protein